MAPIDPKLTARYYVDYEGPSGAHTLQFRAAPSASQPTVINAVLDVVDKVKDLWPTSVTVTGMRYATAGTNVTNPLDLVPFLGTRSGVQLDRNYPLSVGFVARTSLGHRVRLFVFGTVYVPDVDYRIHAAQDVYVDAVCNALIAHRLTLVGIDSLPPVWKRYANLRYNAYYQTKARERS